MTRFAIVVSLWLTVVLAGRAAAPETSLHDLVAASDLIVVARIEEGGRAKVLEAWKGAASEVMVDGEVGDVVVVFLDEDVVLRQMPVVNGHLDVSEDALPGTMRGLRSLVRAAA